MFRRAITAAGKMAVGVGAVQLGAAGVALSDKELAKKPPFYQEAVRQLEQSLKDMSKYSFIESAEKLNKAEAIFTRVSDLNDPNVLWRLARVLVEKAELSQDQKKKCELLHQAIKHASNALAHEPSSGLAGAHKWYALALERLIEVDAKFKKDGSNNSKVVKHLERATTLDSKDPYAWFLLGRAQFKSKDYKTALESFHKAENIKPHHSVTNLYYLGETNRLLGNTDEATKLLLDTLRLPCKHAQDNASKLRAKTILLGKLKKKPADLIVEEEL